MEKRTKELRLGAALVTDGTGAVEVVGLRPDADHDGAMVLKPVPVPSETTLPAGWEPLVKIDGQLVISKGRSVASLVSGTAMVADGELPGAARCSVPVGDERLVMCEDGAAYVGVADGVPEVRAVRRDFPAISLYGVDDADVSVTVGSRTLSRTYSSGLFDRKDRDALVGDLAGAYCRLCADAAAGGLIIQPALARYRLLDSAGEVLFDSPPVLLTHSGGAQCTATVGLYSADRLTVDPYTLVAGTWHLEAALPSLPGSGVAQAEILMTPLFHPYDPSLGGTALLGRASSPSDTFARVGLPGRERGLGTVYRDNARRIIMQAVARIEMLEQRVAVIHDPFGGAMRTVRVGVPVNPDPVAETSKIKSAFSRRVITRPYASVMLGRPHTFSAACGATASGAVAWGGLKVMRYEGYPVQAFAASPGDGEWRSVSAVHFDGDKGVLRREEGNTGAPAKLGPLLCYPAPDARELTIVCHHGGANHAQTFALTPDASGRYAVYVDSDMKPFALPQCSPTVAVGAGAGDICLDDMIAFAETGRPLEIVATVSAGSGIVALAGHAGTDQSWDFGRSRFVAACRDAVCSAGVSLATGRVGLRTMLQCGIRRRDALAVGADMVYVAVADGIVVLPRGGAVRRLSRGRGYEALGYDGARDELWALRDDGGADVFCRRHGWGRYAAGGPQFDSFVQLDGLYLSAGRRLYALGGESGSTSPVRLCLRGVPSPRHAAVRPRCLIMAAQASAVKGTLTAGASGVAGLRPWLIRRASVDGSLAGPLAMSLPARGAGAVDVCLEAVVSPDFVFDSFTFVYE